MFTIILLQLNISVFSPQNNITEVPSLRQDLITDEFMDLFGYNLTVLLTHCTCLPTCYHKQYYYYNKLPSGAFINYLQKKRPARIFRRGKKQLFKFLHSYTNKCNSHHSLYAKFPQNLRKIPAFGKPKSRDFMLSLEFCTVLLLLHNRSDYCRKGNNFRQRESFKSRVILLRISWEFLQLLAHGYRVPLRRLCTRKETYF